MRGVAEGTLPGAHMCVYLDNGIHWTFSGNTLKGYMKDLLGASQKGLNTITVINRFPELGNIQETINIHLQKSYIGYVRVAQLDGVSSYIIRRGQSGQWTANQNTKPQFFQDAGSDAANPFHGIRSSLHRDPLRILITPQLAKSGGQLRIAGYGNLKKIISFPALDSQMPSYSDSMKEYLYPGQPVDTSDFFRIEIVPTQHRGLFLPTHALWIPSEGKIYTASNAFAAKSGKFTLVEAKEAKYSSLLKLFDTVQPPM